MKRCLKIIVKGKVQGVGYRDFVQKHAEKLMVEGTIQNIADASVLIYAAGDATKLEDFIDVLYVGPSRAKVSEILVEPIPHERDFRKVFRVIGEE